MNGDLDRTDERFAQSTIRLKRPVTIEMGGTGDPGKALPSAMLNGYIRSMVPLTAANDDEEAIVAFKDSDANSIDIFYVERVFKEEGGQTVGTAYYKGRNQTGNAVYQNFVVLASARRIFSQAHEILHILLDSGHRAANPNEATIQCPYVFNKHHRGHEANWPIPGRRPRPL